MPVYFDHNATTPLHPKVLEAMIPFFKAPQNASSLHYYGRQAKEALQSARQVLADAMQVAPSQVYFTSGGSESNNLALKGMARRTQPGEMIISAIEHDCVREAVRTLVTQNWRAKVLPVDGDGVVSLAQLPGLISKETRLAAVMLANNESGVIQPTAKVREALPSGVYLHVDAVQALGKMPFTMASTGAHTLSLSSHKVFGPQGVGALIVEKAVDIGPMIDGGGQERGLRSGTENLAGIVGFAAAVQLIQAEMTERIRHYERLQRHLEQALAALGNVTILGKDAPRLPNTTLIAVPNMDGETLSLWLNDAGFCVSSGSACSSGKSRGSHVVEAMQPDLAGNSVRISFGLDNSVAEIDAFIKALAALLEKVKPASWW